MPVDQELSALATVASLLPTDIIYLVRDPGGVAEADNKVAVSVFDTRYLEAADVGSAAYVNVNTLATAAQGALADTALQAAAIGVTVQAYNAGLSAITAFGYSLIDDVDAAAGRATLVAAGTGVANTFTAAQLIDGATDVIQLAVEAAASQTVALMTFRASGGGVRSSMDATAYGWRVGDATSRGNISIGATANNNNMAIQIDRSVPTPVANCYGVSGEMNITGTATISVVAGLSFSARLTHTSGTVTNAYGVDTLVRNTSTGTATSMTGVRIQAGVNSGGGSVGTLYGLRVMDQTVGGTNYAIQTGLGLVEFGDRLKVKQSGSAAVQPALYLEQLDIDQPMIEFVNTIGAGNAIEAVGAKTLTTTHFIMVKLPGGLTRYIPVGTIA